MVVEQTVESQKPSKNKAFYVECSPEQGPDMGKPSEAEFRWTWMVFSLQNRRRNLYPSFSKLHLHPQSMVGDIEVV